MRPLTHLTQKSADVHNSHLGVRGGWGVAGASPAEQACLEGAEPLDCRRVCRLVPGTTLHLETQVIILDVRKINIKINVIS